eukprot:2096064-Amphidinium_carterae.1
MLAAAEQLGHDCKAVQAGCLAITSKRPHTLTGGASSFDLICRFVGVLSRQADPQPVQQS